MNNEMIFPIRHGYETRGRLEGNLDHLKPHLDIRKYSFAARSPVIWDGVPLEAKKAMTVNGFKNIYDRNSSQ